jgi:site-specific DNA-cytosine methylase
MDWTTHPTPATRPATVRQALASCAGGDRIMSPKYRAYWSASSQGQPVGRFETSKRLTFDKPSFTIAKSHGYGGVYHPTECRPLSIAELAALCSFPTWFKFAGSWKQSKDRIGNSVPPKLMEAVARNLATAPFMPEGGR